MNIRTLVGNGILAALYIAVSMLIQPFGFTNVQFRISEMFNHLVVFNKKAIYGIVLGVFLTNLFFSPMIAYDLVFGVGQSILALVATIISMRFIKGVWARMIFNTVIFILGTYYFNLGRRRHFLLMNQYKKRYWNIRTKKKPLL